jgi:ArsR family transcriptional regulator, arsenate/arsenite/antimonite-responsive transcriptional repressor
MCRSECREVVVPKKSVVLLDESCCPSVVVEALDDDQASELARAFAALSDPVRLRAFNLIATAGELCSCDLVEPLDRSQPTVSHHTKALADAGLIFGEKRGRWVWWSIVPERLAALRDALGA